MLNPFLSRARSYPLKLIIDIHSYCDARCRMCPYPRYSRTQTQGSMPWTLYRKIVSELAALGRQHRFQPRLTYCYMAEPFLADDLPQHAHYAQDRGLDVYLNTNASEMTPPKIDALLAGGFHGQIHVSFHGFTPETYRKIMGLDYHRSLAHIEYLLDHYDPARVCIRGVDDGWPPGERERWFEFWRPRRVQLEYLPPISRCGSISRLVPEKIKQPTSLRLYGCREHHPLVEMVVLFDGRAVMCCQDMAREVIWGDLTHDSILDVWNAPPRRQLVNRLYSGAAHRKDFLCARCEQALLSRTALTGSILHTAAQKIKRLARPKSAAAL